MRTRALGSSGIHVSEIGLGTWPAGGSVFLAGAPTGYGTVPETEALRAIQRGLELGVTFFDSSDMYGLGRAERILGRAIASRGAEAVIATKAGWVPDDAERWMKDLSADHLRAAAARSRARLGVESIDLFQLHAIPEPGAETDEALDALDELKTRGVIRLAGASVGADLAAGLRLVESGRIDAIQVYYNLLQQGAAGELFDACRKRGVGVVAAIPLAYGFLAGRTTRGTVFASDDWRSRLTRDEIAARVGRVEELRFLTREGARTMVHAALQFVLAHPAVSTTIPGFRSPEQVEGIVSALEAEPLSDIEIARARELGRAWASPQLART
jgi:aryl-alcohol dehydrogenase-like predicted oxidoreductase